MTGRALCKGAHTRRAPSPPRASRSGATPCARVAPVQERLLATPDTRGGLRRSDTVQCPSPSPGWPRRDHSNAGATHLRSISVVHIRRAGHSVAAGRRLRPARLVHWPGETPARAHSRLAAQWPTLKHGSQGGATLEAVTWRHVSKLRFAMSLTLHAPAPVRVHSAVNAHSSGSRVSAPLAARCSEAARGSTPRLALRRGSTAARVARSSGVTPHATLSLDGLFDALVRRGGKRHPVLRGVITTAQADSPDTKPPRSRSCLTPRKRC